MESINYDLKDLHDVQLELLKKLIFICDKYGFSWFLGFGSLLGAVREHRIIVWDDSIDVVMPYADYDKLVHLPQAVWGENIFMQTYETDPQYPRCYAKLRNSRTTLVKADYVSCDINQGIYINIMPIIHLADDQEERTKQQNDAKLYKAITEGTSLPVTEKAFLLQLSLWLDSSEEKKKKKREELKTRILSYENQKTEQCFVLAGNVSLGLALQSDWFSEAVNCEFEDISVRIPKGWQEWLTLRYGDYTVTPITELQGDKLAGFITLNTKKPYLDYKGKTYYIQ